MLQNLTRDLAELLVAPPFASSAWRSNREAQKLGAPTTRRARPRVTLVPSVTG